MPNHNTIEHHAPTGAPESAASAAPSGGSESAPPRESVESAAPSPRTGWDDLADTPPSFAGTSSRPQAPSSPTSAPSSADAPAAPHRPFIPQSVRQEVFRQDEADFLRAGTPLLHADKTESGRYRVNFPAMQDLESGALVGQSALETDDYIEATNFLRAQSENLETLGHDFLLKMRVKDTDIAFCSLDRFHPAAAIEKIPTAPNAIVTELLRDDSSNIQTYQRTIQQDGWQKPLFAFVQDFATSDPSLQSYLEQSGIRDFSQLSPQQAVGLTTNLVLALTKFNESYERNDSPADHSTALELLQAGRANIGRPDWPGNGVCRNFASVTKAVFEAIKDGQGRYSQLQNTYCALRGSASREDYRPDYYDSSSAVTTGHAWNDFIQVSHQGNEAAVLTVDVTWAERDLQTKEILGLDQTAERVQRPLRTLARELEPGPAGDAAAQNILSFYDTLLQQPQRTPSGKEFYAHEILDLLGRRDPNFLNSAQFQKNAVAAPFVSGRVNQLSQTDFGTLANFYPADQNFQQKLVDAYLTQKTGRPNFVFADDNLQKAVVDGLKRHGQFDFYLKHRADFRERVEALGL